MIMVFIVYDPVALQLQYAIVGTQFQKDFLKYMVGGKSDSAKDMYVEESLEDRLHATK